MHIHTQVTGKCGAVLVRLIPAPRGTGIVAAAVPKKLLTMAGVSDCYTSARGQTATLGNFGALVRRIWGWGGACSLTLDLCSLTLDTYSLLEVTVVEILVVF